jgi:uncharacterized lipoprotein YbaY/uncharacterized lipoprotein NlpE involved in copper resistance
MTNRFPFAAVLMALTAAAASAQTPVSTAPSIVTGTVVYREAIALPEDATVRVRLLDASDPELPPKAVAETTIAARGRQVPIPFEIAYAAGDIKPSRRYVVSATISAGGRTLFASRSRYPVITRGAPTNVEILVQAAGGERRPHASPLGSLPATYTGVLPCRGCEGIRQTVTLYPDGTFVARSERIDSKTGRDDRTHDLGRWELDREGGLELHGGGKGPSALKVVDPNTLELADAAAEAGAGNRQLHRAPDVDRIGDTMPLSGEYAEAADGGWFTECLTGKRLRVPAEGEAAALALAWKEARLAEGRLLFVTLGGRIESRWSAGGSPTEVVIVDRFDRSFPGRSCPAAAAAQSH